MKKGQVEMIGLVIIVFLIVIIGIFIIKLGALKKDNDADIYYSMKVDNLVNAIYQADVGGDTFESLAVSCCDGNTISCEKVNDFVDSVLDRVIEESVGFYLKDSSGFVCSGVAVGDCDEGMGSSSIFLPGGYEIRANLCRK
jgi:hypothetical protein